jgi:hypothetical protein
MTKIPRDLTGQPSLVRFATPYLEVESQSSSSLERTIRRELAQARHTASRNERKRGDQPASIRARMAGPP